MLQITLIAVGKLKETYWTEATREYQKRLGALCKFSIVEVEEHRLPNHPSDSHIRKGLEQEGKAILSKIPPRAYVVPLCIEGKQLASPALANKLSELSLDHSHIAFLIGGSYGLSNEAKEKGDWKLSMSQMTFPHQLARVMLAEQIYRALTILGNQKYHK